MSRQERPSGARFRRASHSIRSKRLSVSSEKSAALTDLNSSEFDADEWVYITELQRVPRPLIQSLDQELQPFHVLLVREAHIKTGATLAEQSCKRRRCAELCLAQRVRGPSGL